MLVAKWEKGSIEYIEDNNMMVTSTVARSSTRNQHLKLFILSLG